MKKVLFATTALIATAGVASADITLNGSAVMGYQDNGTVAPGVHTEIEFDIVASGTSDNGLSFGASMDIDGNTTRTNASNAFDENAADTEVFVSGAFGTLTMGDVSVASDISISDVGFDGISADDLSASDVLIGGAITADVSWSYSVNGVGIAVSYDSVRDDTAASVSYTVNGFTGTVAFGEDNATSDSVTVAKGSYSANGLTIQAMFSSYDDADANANDAKGSGIYVGYAIDPNLTVAFAASQNDEGTGAADTNASGVGFSYNMGGGLTLAGGVGSDEADRSVWDLGLSMSF